jgi:glutamate synthase domain-containing protein 3
MTGGRVVVLGEIGKNFAAGMSGGIAYIYDANNTQKSKINPSMVHIETIEEELESDKVKNMIMNHLLYTKSKTAYEMLENWEETKKKFIKVIPKDYKKILLQNANKCGVQNDKVEG